MKIVVRELAAKDRKSWAKCFSVLQSIEASLEPDRLQPSVTLENNYWDYLHSQCAQKRGRIFVAMADTEVCGFVAGWIDEDAANLITTLHRFGYISDISIAPDFRGQGIGRKLMNEIEAYLKEQGVTVVKVGVLAKNSGAHDFYSECGYHNHEISLIKSFT
jgi:ribosomal protein S18 acetylase RimI-like enzyme